MNADQFLSQRPESTQRIPAAPTSEPAPVVVKVGGSLLDLPDLSDRLSQFMASYAAARVVLVVGGGPAADLVRNRHQLDHLDEDRSHWLAVRAMSFNSFLIEALLPDSIVVTSLAQCEAAWTARRKPIVDPHSFLMADEASGSELPRCWAVTSDTIAARVARACQAQELVLLKSVSWPPDASLEAAAGQGIVDEHFPREVSRSAKLHVRIVNLRA